MTIKTEKIILNEERNVQLTAMVQDVGGEFGNVLARPAVLILPGGGYAMCSDREAEVIAYSYLNQGYHAFVLRYSVAEHKAWPNPLEDYEQAMDLLEVNAQTWHILTDKIAVIGFSAGGHLAACAATLAKHRPAAAILGYAALSKALAEACQPNSGIPSPIDHVDGHTCPCFLFAARDDSTVPLTGMLDFERKLYDYGIQFESHIYAYGGHGFGTGLSSISTGVCNRVPNWTSDSIGWLEDVLGELEVSGMKAPRCAPKVNGNGEEYLSLDCTLEYLRKQPQAEQVLAEVFTEIDNIIAARFPNSTIAAGIIYAMKLRELLSLLSMSKEELIDLSERLNAIRNEA